MAEGAEPRVVAHADAEAFLARARAWLEAREDEHNLILGLASALRDVAPGPGPEGYLLATVERAAQVVGCVFRTPPHKVGLTRMPPEAAAPVAASLAVRYDTIPGMMGPPDVVSAVAEVWARLRGVRVLAGAAQRMYRLDTVVLPEGVGGRMRAAGADDLPTLHAWGEAFAAEAGLAFRAPPATRAGWVERGVAFLWEDEGEPVSMAVVPARTGRGSRIGYVYTPPERRGRGYASALVARVSEREVEEGRFCVLYTDLANPTSNAIYRAVGYRPLCDVLDVTFTDADG